MDNDIYKWANKRELPDERLKHYSIRIINEDKGRYGKDLYKYAECFCDEAGWSEWYLFDFEWLKEIKQPPTNINKAIEERINYLIEVEKVELEKLDTLTIPMARQIQWGLVNELGYRKNELQQLLFLDEGEEIKQSDKPII